MARDSDGTHTGRRTRTSVGEPFFREIPKRGGVQCFQQLGRRRYRRPEAQSASEEVGGAFKVAADRELQHIGLFFRLNVFRDCLA